MDTEVVDVLRRARARIEDPAKWHQGDMYGPGGSCCVVAALADARDELMTSASGRVWVLFAEVVGTSDAGHHLGDWNDAPERTHAEVLAAFDRAIELAESSC